ncbi:MAG: AAA family ATPase [Planctomycetota bacterium]|jgi:MoxR-like ATPase
MDVKQIGAQVEREAAFLEKLNAQLSKVIVGQKDLLKALVLGLLADGHVLLEGVPGLAKTLSVETLARSLDATFQRIQFTPDLLPADLLGTLIYTPQGGFETRKGPIFAHVILADEINRAPAKVQSALLEAMQERTVTIGEETHALPKPFTVLATQNPIEQEGTYPLPEAQVDRFLLKVHLTYPTRDEERQILDLALARGAARPEIEAVIHPDDLLRVRGVVREIYMDDKIKNYIVDLVLATRNPASHGLDLEGIIEYGASPRATIGLGVAARAHAFLNGRAFVTPQDVKDVALWVLPHRVVLTYEAEAEQLGPIDVVQRLLDGVKVP